MQTTTRELPVVEATAVCFTNLHGGTGMTNWKHDPRLPGPISVRVFKAWHDYETGYRFVGVACEPRLQQYLEQVSPADRREVYVGQFDLVANTSHEAAEKVIAQLADCCQFASTADNMVFRRRDDGSWASIADPELVYRSAGQLMHEFEIAFDATRSAHP